MYECHMKMIVPSGVGLLMAGLASGICFLLIGSLRKGKGEKNVDDSRCACCLKPFLLGRGVECSDCGGKSCRKACCRWDSVDKAWFCLFCYHSRSWSRKKEKWFKNFGGLPAESEISENFSTARSRIYDQGAEDVAIHSELDLAAGGCKERDSMETVREFVEKIVEGLVGNVDDTPIDRLYDHPAYDRLFEAHGILLASALTRLTNSLRQCVDNKPATDTPTMAHTALRELVERAVDEARKLPGLGATVSTGVQDDLSFSEQNYENLLATAILNKVIEKFQNERVDDNSNVLLGRPRSKLAIHDKETGFDEDVEEGSSSLEPQSNDDQSNEEGGPRTRKIHGLQEPLSLTIEEQIEEVTTTYTSDEELRCSKTTVLDFRNARRVPFPEFGMDIVDPSQDSSDDSQEDDHNLTHVDRITPVESWEENWLFQKRRIQTQSEPVAMLVPNPSSDFRALIGDKDAEDTSDLSEFSAQSDDEAESEELTEAINRVIPKTSKVDTHFLPDFDEVSKILELSESNGSNTKELSINQDRLDVNSKPEFIHPTNKDDKYENKTSQTNEKIKEKKLSTNSMESENHFVTNQEIPKTPPSSPIRYSLSENTPENSTGCDVQQLNANVNSIDNIIDETAMKKELSRTERPKICEDSTDEKIEKNVELSLSEIEVERHSMSSTMNGCLKVNSRDVDNDGRREVEDSGRCNIVVEEVLKNSLEAKIKLNGDVEGMKNEQVVENGVSSEVTDRKCQALAQAKADSASEKPVNESIGFATPPRPGTIAEREHKKWENAAPIENNPYSEENIQKRLLERQYARRSSDVSGSSTKLQTSPSPPLQIILGAGRPDFKRFGRDYYINEAKCPKGQTLEESGFFTATSRPNSSLSQHSLSTGSDYEQQERSQSADSESMCSTSSEPKFVSELQHSTVDAALLQGSMPVGKGYEASEIQTRDSRNDETRQSLNDVSLDKTWNGQNSFDEILDRERKNSKNEINAKLNNRGNFEEIQKPIRRIDLRAYGFENEFNVKNRDRHVQSKRVINKLDLRSFGYDSGLRRTQSNNNIDRPVNSRYNPRNFQGKSNNGRFSAHPSLTSLEGSDDEILTQSNEALIEDRDIDCQKFGRITSAKSVPNIGDLYSRVNDTATEDNYEETVDNIRNARSTSVEEDGSNEFKDTFQTKNNINKPVEVHGERERYVEKKLPMPSVRRLAQAFNKTVPVSPVATRRSSKSVNILSKERPTTPEIHIVDTPRQMHSLTARSLSREFREGLRQMSNKQAPYLRPNIIPEQNRLQDTQSPTNSIGSSEDVSVIAPGKLKNNIQFWEQLNRKN